MPNGTSPSFAVNYCGCPRGKRLVGRYQCDLGALPQRADPGKMQIRVQDILELYAAGQNSEQFLADFPDLELEDLKAALKCFSGFKEANRG